MSDVIGLAGLTGHVTTVTAGDTTLTIAPTAGAVIAARSEIAGDVSIPAGSNIATLAGTGVVAGDYTLPSVTVGADGRITAASSGGSLGGPAAAAVTFTTASTLIYSTDDLAVGTWLVTASVSAFGVTTGQPYAVELTAGTATATIHGPTSAGGYAHGTTAAECGTATVTALVDVTVAGGLAINAIASVSDCTAAVSGVGGYAGAATGWTAIQLAS